MSRTDAGPRAGQDRGGMRIEIEVRPAPVPCGEVVVDGAGAQRFDGWLQLLAILGEALPRPTSPSVPYLDDA